MFLSLQYVCEDSIPPTSYLPVPALFILHTHPVALLQAERAMGFYGEPCDPISNCLNSRKAMCASNTLH